MKKELIGSVGVDSGQLMICDPCYIDEKWEKEVFEDIRRYKHFKSDKTLTYRKDFSNYEEIIKEYGKNMNQMIKDLEVKELLPPGPKKNFSYNACCSITLAPQSAGQLFYVKGRPGIAVVFSSGYGDGFYPVYAEKNKDGRIVRITIDMGSE